MNCFSMILAQARRLRQRGIYRANKAKEKRVYLEAFLDDFELLKFEIRLCVDMKILSIKKQAVLSQLMDSIGKPRPFGNVLHRPAKPNC